MDLRGEIAVELVPFPVNGPADACEPDLLAASRDDGRRERALFLPGSAFQLTKA